MPLQAVRICLCTILVLLCQPSLSSTEDNTDARHETTATNGVEEVVIYGVRQRLEQAGALLDVIQKTEVINAANIEAKHAVNLSEAIKEAPGVRVSNDCSMCGVKRIMLNGLKGEHTTILTDGLPVHTMISGYYAVDAIATTGLDRIEVARGAGASLTTPEAMGGTINIVTLEGTENGGTIDVSGGEDGYRQVGFMATGIANDDRTRVTLIGQYDSRDQFDGDNNGVSENPLQTNRSVTLRLTHDISQRDNLTLRYSRVLSEIFGGPMLGQVTNSINSALASYQKGRAAQLFVDNDVNKRFIGRPWETTEWVDTRRSEFSMSWIRELNDQWSMTLSGSFAEHIQDSFYEGFDYYGDDNMHYYDARFHYVMNDEHVLTMGVDTRSDRLRSSSEAGKASSAYIADSFDYETRGFYIQDRWTPGDWIELAIALRIDKVRADFTDPSKPGTEIAETVVSPRLDSRFFHNEQWTSRVSVGRGYRAPLSFFETDHGILDGDAGFAIEVDALERSLTGSYALSFEGERLTSTLSMAWTKVENLAGVSETAAGVPVLSQNDKDASVGAVDWAVGYQITDELLVNLILEKMDYNDEFKASYTIAPIEERLTLSFDYDINGWDLFFSASWVGARNLSEYGYWGTDVLGSSQPKPLRAPSYWVADFRLAKALNSSLSVYLGANNLLDYTQAGDESSPLTYDDVSNPDAGYDVAYIYGPLRGRQWYAGLKWMF